MRIRQILLAALAAAALTGSLTACSGASGSAASASSAAGAAAAPSASASGAAVDLVGTVWKVAGKAGTTVRFNGFSVTVASGDESSSYAWSAQGSEVLLGASTSSLNGPVGAPWLTATTQVRRTGSGWTLLDASGSATATLTPAGTADPTTATTLLTPATPGSGVVDRPASALDGTWTPAGEGQARITFADGTWSAASSCRTGAVGGRGAYRVLPGGRLLVTRTSTPIRGCPIVDGPITDHANAITAIARAASFRIEGDTLTLFDRAGTGLGSLTRR